MSVNVQIELARRSDLLRLHCESSLQRVGPSRQRRQAMHVWCGVPFYWLPALQWLEGFAGRCVLPRVGEYQRVFHTELSRTVVQFAKQLYLLIGQEAGGPRFATGKSHQRHTVHRLLTEIGAV